jgi:hypothetical protein
MAKKVFVSFDYENDSNLRELLRAWNANRSHQFNLIDKTPKEINSNDYKKVKERLTKNIRQSDVTLVICGEEANRKHPHSNLIEDNNWQWWEINKSLEEDIPLIGVRVKTNHSLCTPLRRNAKSVINGFHKGTQTEIFNALKRV